MPELPEVETIARRLQTVLPGKWFAEVRILHPKPFIGDQETLIGRQILSVHRQAKQIRIRCSNDLNLVVHLKMTGQLIFVDLHQRVGGGHPTADWVQELPSPHTRCYFTFDDGSYLFFNDQRIFGWLRLLTSSQLTAENEQLAPDIIDPKLTAEYLLSKWKSRTQAIKVVLLDTSITNGLGNIYVAEALFVAGISPFRPAASLSLSETQRLLKACQTVVHEGILMGGTTFDGQYVNVEGFAGSYQEVARVYKKAGTPCKRCGSNIAKTMQNGRGTYYCPNCQI